MNMFMIFGLGVWLPKLMMNAGFPLGSSLWFMLSLNLGAIVGCAISGVLADRIGSKRMVTILYALAFVFINMLSIKNDIVVLTLLVAAAGACTLGAQNVAHGYVSQFYPPSMRSTGMGWAFGIGRFGAILGPTLGGILMTMNVSLFTNFMGFAIPGLIACIAIFLAQDRYSYAANAGKPQVTKGSSVSS